MNRFKFILFLLITASNLMAQDAPAINYTLGMPAPETHYFEVGLKVNKVLSNPKLLDKERLLLKMPVWTPGSYLVREFARHVQDFEAKNELGEPLASKKINKNTWEIWLDKAESLEINYKLYANDLTVRTSFIDAAHGYVNGASVFMFIPELMKEKAELEIFPYEKWSTISTALPEKESNVFIVKDYDTLVDSPIEIGNHEVLSFEAAGNPHKIALFTVAPLNYNKDDLIADYTNMIEATTSIFEQETPLDHYLFIIHHQPGIGGGLEHLFSTTCQTSTTVYESEKEYKSHFSTLAHEYFHSWNVKRIRPMALGPFDYERENYTHMLWVAEGFTNFYEEIILRKAGIYTESEVLNNHATNLSAVFNRPGNYVQSASESSWDAWIKYYRPNANSSNSGVSYYAKGGALAALLQAIIIAETKGEKSMDDVMNLLYKKYYQELNRGYTDEEFQQAIETVAGVSLDEFFQNYVWDTKTPEFAKIFAKVGLLLIDNNKSNNNPYIGIAERNGYVSNLNSRGSAYHSGLNVGDLIISIDGTNRISFAQALKSKKVGDNMSVEIMRSGNKHAFSFTLKRDERFMFELSKIENLNAEQNKLNQKFFGF